jgi:hypothetical protein
MARRRGFLLMFLPQVKNAATKERSSERKTPPPWNGGYGADCARSRRGPL